MPRTPWLLVTGRAGAFLGLAGVCSLGCLSAPSEAPGPGGGVPDTKDADSLGVPEAYFTLDGSDLRSAAWPQEYDQYSLFVCTPSISADEVATIHRDIPGSIALAYTNIADIALGEFPGNPYNDALTAAFDSTFCVIDLWTDQVVHMETESGVGYPHFVIRQESADVLVAFHRDVTMLAGWDGLYVDQCEASYPPWRARSLTDNNPVFDATGDGVMDTIEDVEQQYATWRPYYTQRLRQALGNAVILVGNSGGALADPTLNGITLEGVGTRFTIPQAAAALLGQRDVSRMPFLAALWVTTDGSRAPSLALAQEIAGVHYGTVEYFP